jgi:hypothetical protein
LQSPGHLHLCTELAAIDMDFAAALGLELGMLSGDEEDMEPVLHPPTNACPTSTERRSQVLTTAGLAYGTDALCAMQGESDVEEDEAEEHDPHQGTPGLRAIASVPAVAQPAATRRGRRTNGALQILAQAAAAAAAAASLGGQQQPAKKSRNDICAAARAKKTKRQQLPTGTAVLKGRVLKWFSPAQQKALRNILYSTSAGGVSAIVMGDLLGVQRLWLPHLHRACAEEMMVQDESAFHNMLVELRRLRVAGLVEPMQFTLFRMYDETPERFRTLTAAGSSVEADCCTAKVLACQREWCMLFARRGSASQPTEPGEAAARPSGFAMGAMSGDSATEYTAVWGVLTTSLVPIQNQTAEVLLTATRRMAWLPPDCQAIVEEIFPRRALVSTTDMHGSNVKAERAMAKELAVDCAQPSEPFAAERHGRHRAEAKRSCGWNCVQVRCEMHRSHTCELKTHDIAAATVSGVLNVGLSLRIPGAAGRLRRALRKLFRETGRLEILYGHPAHEVIVWRTAITDLFARQGTKRSRTRAAVISRLCNGDWRLVDRLQHYCSPSCCPGGRAETLSKFDRHLVPALTKRLPMIFPRRKWIGSDESLDDCGWLLACHGVLGSLFEEATSAAAAAPNARPPPARGPRPRRPAASPAALGVPAAIEGAPPPAALPAAAADIEPDSREDNEIKRDVARGFLADEPLAHIVLLRVVLEPFRTMKARLLECSSAAWRERQLIPTSGQRTHPLTRSWHADEAEDALVALTSLMLKKNSWHALDTNKLRDVMWAVTALRLLARAGAGIRELLIAEQRVYPYKLFATLGQPDMCEDVAADFKDRPCMLDPVSASICSDHASAFELRSSAARSKIMSIAELVQTSTAKVECGHAAVRRRARGQVQTHAPSLAVQSAHRAVARGRRLASEAWPTRSGMQGKPGQNNSQPGQAFQEAQGVQPKGLKRAAPSGNDGTAEPASNRRGGGGGWRVFVHEEAEKKTTSFRDAGVLYRGLSAFERDRLGRVGRLVTAARRSGIANPLGQRRRTGSNRDFKALGKRKRAAKLANARWDRHSQLAAVQAEFAERHDLMGAAMAADRHCTKTALRAEDALLQGLRRHASSMAAAGEPGICPSGDLFDEPGGQLLPTGGHDPDGGADSGSDTSAGSRALQPAAAGPSQAPPPAVHVAQQLRSLWHLPRRLESVEAAVSALGTGPGSGVMNRSVEWEARHTVITGAECPKILQLPPVPQCQRAGRCICRGPGSSSAALYRRIQTVLGAFVRPVGASAATPLVDACVSSSDIPLAV